MRQYGGEPHLLVFSPMIRAAVLLLAILSTHGALAIDRYVRTDGNDTRCNGGTNAADTGSGTNQPCAWRTVAKGVGSTGIVAGDRLLIQPGKFREYGVKVASSGALESSSLLSNCTCTAGSTTISCASAIPSTVNPGDYIRCNALPDEDSAPASQLFRWSKVQSASGTTVTLAEPYRGATSGVPGSDTIAVAKFVEIIGSGTDQTTGTLVTSWFPEPASVAWTPVAGTSCVYTYTTSAATDPDGTTQSVWRDPKGFRDDDTPFQAWDTKIAPIGGRDPYVKVTGTSCPCAHTPGGSLAINVDSLPGSWGLIDTNADGTNEVYLSTRDCVDPDTRQMLAGATVAESTSSLVMEIDSKSFVILRDLSISAGKASSPYNKDDTQAGSGVKSTGIALRLKPINSIMINNVVIENGVMNLSLTGLSGANAVRETVLHGVRMLDGLIWNDPDWTTATLSQFAMYASEIRGNQDTLLSTNGMVGASAFDRILFDRMYFHRNMTDFIGAGDQSGSCNGNSITWNCSTKQFVDDTAKTRGDHCVYMGSAAAGANYIDHVMIRNSIFEFCTDGWGVFGNQFGGALDIHARNNTIAAERGIARRNGVLFGKDAGVSNGIRSYNNLFYYEFTQDFSAGFLARRAAVNPNTQILSDYNAYLVMGFDLSPGNSNQVSPRIWNSGETLATVIPTYGQEQHSMVLCQQDCAASPGTHYVVGTNSGLTDPSWTDGTPTDFTPVSTAKWVNAGRSDFMCPLEDFKGNPRNDGQCDIGAIEYVPPTPINTFPAIGSVSGTFAHGQVVTISGVNFGAKVPAAPTIWDTATGADIRTTWDGAWPSVGVSGTDCASVSGGLSGFNTEYRSFFRGITGPHKFATKYIAGSHGQNINFCAGLNVMFWKKFTMSSYPQRFFISYYRRFDDAWVSGLGTPADDNLKEFDFAGPSASGNAEPYQGGRNWYYAWTVSNPTGPKQSTCATTADDGVGINDDGDSSNRSIEATGCLPPQTTSGCNAPTDCTACNLFTANDNPFCGRWDKIEIEFLVSNLSGAGRFTVWRNGAKQYEYNGKTDGITGTNRAIGIGGFARSTGNGNNWRYYTDVMLDNSFARVMICDGATWSSHGPCEPQIPSAWSSTSITATVNQAAIASGSTKYLYVVEADGDANETGFLVTFQADAVQVEPNVLHLKGVTVKGVTVK